MLSSSLPEPRPKRSYRRLGNGDVLLDGPRACSYGADDVSVQRDRDAAAEDDNLTGIGVCFASSSVRVV